MNRIYDVNKNSGIILKYTNHWKGHCMTVTWDWSDIVITSAVVLTIIWAAIKYYVKSYVNNYFIKQLENHKHDLQKIMESMRFDFQRKTQDFILFTNRKHEKYALIYDLYLRAEGKVRGILKIEFNVKKISQLELHQLEAYLKRHKLPENKVENILIDWVQGDKGKISSEIINLVLEVELSRSRELFNNAKNEFLLNRIYLSSDVTSLIYELNKQLNNILFAIDFFSNNKFQNTDEIHEDIMKSMIELT